MCIKTKFRDAHLLWVKNHKEFAEQINNHTETLYGYIDVLREMYFGHIHWLESKGLPTDVYNREMERMAEKQLRDDMARFAEAQQALVQVALPQTEKPDWFITLGFNHQTWDVQKCSEIINKVLSLPFIKDAEAVFELYRQNGEHPHCHFYIETINKIPKSKILEKIWAVAGIKKVILNKNFIDIKIAQPIHKKYVKGEKRDEKLEYVEKDKVWRKENNIPDLFRRV